MKPNTGTAAELVSKEGIAALRDLPLKDGNQILYVHEKCIANIAKIYDGSEPDLEPTNAWRERVYGSAHGSEADLVQWITLNTVYPAVEFSPPEIIEMLKDYSNELSSKTLLMKQKNHMKVFDPEDMTIQINDRHDFVLNTIERSLIYNWKNTLLRSTATDILQHIVETKTQFDKYSAEKVYSTTLDHHWDTDSQLTEILEEIASKDDTFATLLLEDGRIVMSSDMSRLYISIEEDADTWKVWTDDSVLPLISPHNVSQLMKEFDKRNHSVSEVIDFVKDDFMKSFENNKPIRF